MSRCETVRVRRRRTPERSDRTSKQPGRIADTACVRDAADPSQQEKDRKQTEKHELNTMRNTFIKTLLHEAEKDNRIVFLTGDLGYSVVEEFAIKCPGRYYNVGISEQNMIGVSAGMALCGLKPVAYSIATFTTMRPFEQVRIDIAFQNADALLVGVGAGLAYGSHGPTHQATEDIAVMRALPNMTVLCPGDPVEAEAATLAALKHKGPVYLRLGKGKEPNVHNAPINLTIGKAITMQEGDDITIITAGDGLSVAKNAADKLRAEHGISVRLISMPCVKPIDHKAIHDAAQETKHIFTLEEHNIIGGLGSAVAEVLATQGSHAPLLSFGVPDRFFEMAGSQAYLRKLSGIDVDSVVERILKAMGK